jgi:1,4-dihydroxy-2-naphthoate octaprenyltransferase
MASLKPYAGVARAPFLLLPFTLIAAGAAASAYANGFNWQHTLVALLGLIALHMAVNTLNEWSDLRTGIDLETRRTPFSGGSGTLPQGELSSRSALVFGLAAAAVGLAVGVWFLTRVGMALLPIMVIGALLVLTYTDLLARIGVGEIAAGLGLGALPVMGAALVQDGFLPQAAIAAAVPAFFMTFNLLLLNEFPDEEADRKGGRRNLVLLLGRPAAAAIYAVAGVLTPVAIVASVVLHVLPPLALVAVLPSALLAKPIRWAFRDPMTPVPLPALGANVVWNLATNSLLAVAIVVTILL